MIELVLTRDVTRRECGWLDRDLPAGTPLYEYTGATYGVLGSGIACSIEPGQTPFFEVPADALARVED